MNVTPVFVKPFHVKMTSMEIGFYTRFVKVILQRCIHMLNVSNILLQMPKFTAFNRNQNRIFVSARQLWEENGKVVAQDVVFKLL